MLSNVSARGHQQTSQQIQKGNVSSILALSSSRVADVLFYTHIVLEYDAWSLLHLGCQVSYVYIFFKTRHIASGHIYIQAKKFMKYSIATILFHLLFSG